ncbi:MarR family transcriptional regulator [Sulfitobacter pseudonitzschiae]|uniref:MarR family transcriptional regulator n=1 Tax=Pseudosulfitobacter pseudonitzschiae TaxID=1402135 RepID=A0A9Q2NN30_9RHOB|nr:MarR family transcriptional regulator [Pseudosulfitobacter pseudonitzschiae]MBM2291804.1 MarR family transcriptional regulator [Pseudosulfitobacter pseudonitzschiae]MBM2296722.1 MarR family transcriptional regulator [Pseudosulfitobacter pseudonitzschiae]MBM2301635.1 MarR family transcriptional regulator [Pseudosulfitobacter pseudonitzschiae]MBM2311418.1 MarR family transcriptional regulator [Pseudosulfitobacter pseudonitzschiae]MBM2316332.1 MarR family transcriptional regulator [Pseudosulfi
MDHVDRVLEQWRTERPDLEVVPMGVLGRLKRLHDRVSAQLEKVYAANGLTAASFDVLATLRRSGAPYALSPSELIAWTMVTSGTMTNRLDRLAAAGLVERKPNPEDGRGSVVALTPQGFALIDRVVTAHVANQHRVLSALSAQDRAALDGLLRQWLGAFEAPQSEG